MSAKPCRSCHRLPTGGWSPIFTFAPSTAGRWLDPRGANNGGRAPPGRKAGPTLSALLRHPADRDEFHPEKVIQRLPDLGEKSA